MSVEKNIANERRLFEEVWNKGNLSLIPELVSPDFYTYATKDIKGHEGYREMVTTQREAFPDYHVTIDDIIGEKDKVFYRITATGTYNGSQGMPEMANIKYTWTQALFTTYKDGKVATAINIQDTVTGFRQAGITPPEFKQKEETNKKIIRRTMDEIWSKGNLSLIPELFTSDYTSHNSSGKTVLGHDGFRKMVESARIGYPDLYCAIDQLVAEGDNIVCLYTLTGTNKGEYLGVAPTGKRVNILALFLTIMRDGKSAETWALNDSLASFQQLGIAPPGYEIIQPQPAII